MPEDHEVCGRTEAFALSVPADAAPGEPRDMLPAGCGDAPVTEAVSRLARELGLAGYADSAEALKSELQKIVLALHPDKSGGEFRCEADKARFMKARRAIELLDSDAAGDSVGAARPIGGAAHALPDLSAPAASPEDEHRVQVTLLAAARGRIARDFAAPKITATTVAAALLVLVLAADRFDRNPLLGPLFADAVVLTFMGILGLAAAAAAAVLWACERAAVRRAEHLLSECALGELFEQARRSARRQ